MATDTRQLLNQILSVCDWTLVGTKKCSNSMKSKQLLHSAHKKYMFVEIDVIAPKRGQTQQEFINEFAFKTNNSKNIPLIFYKGKYVGGYEKLKKSIK